MKTNKADWITKEDFEKAKKALEEADVPGPYYYLGPDGWIALERPRKPVQAFPEGGS